MKSHRQICSLSLDLDNQWSYMKTHGDPGWESFPSYLDVVVPRFLSVLDEFGWKITVFVVGQDATLKKNSEALQRIVAAGHEIGNHSFNHEPWLHLYSKQQIEQEIARTEEAIEYTTGQRPRGFRGPGYSVSRDVLEVLAELEYLYDASILPTFIGPLARAYYFMTSSLNTTEHGERSQLFGRFRDGLRPLVPYRWDVNGRVLFEIPVTTMPVFKLPFHFSYLQYISTFSHVTSILYLKAALLMCRISRIEPSLLLHPLDFLGRDDLPELGFFPAMNTDGATKIARIRQFLHEVRGHYSISGLDAFRKTLWSERDIRTRKPETCL